MADPATVKSLLPYALSLANTIARRAAEAAARSSDGDTSRIMVAIIRQLQKDKEEILEAIRSREEADLATAKQKIRHALHDLELWVQEKRSTEVIHPTANVLDISKRLAITDLSIKSRHYQSAMRRFWEAGDKAVGVFNNKKNTGEMRLKALEICLFSSAIAEHNWQDRKAWFGKWKLGLEFLFEDKDLTALAFQKQSIVSKLLDQGAKEARKQAHCVMRSLIEIIRQMVVTDGNNIEDARNLTKFINEHVNGFIAMEDLSKPPLYACSIYDPRLGIEYDQMLTPEFGTYKDMVGFMGPEQTRERERRCKFTCLKSARSTGRTPVLRD